MNQEATEFLCHVCNEWILKSNYKSHVLTHYRESDFIFPVTVEDMKRRFEQLGYYTER